jgi:hypothetical protein
MSLALSTSHTPGLAAQASPSLPAPPAEYVLGGALTLLHIHESGGDNRGQLVERMLRDVGAPPGAPWCAAYVRRAGYYALLDPATGRSRWPLPATAACQVLADFARANGILASAPVRGDVFLMWNDVLGGFHHTGFVWSVTDAASGYVCTTLEGNTSEGSFPNGDSVAIRIRTFSRGGTTRFIDWTRLVFEARAA